MSRSYRKPFAVDGYGTKHKKIAKRTANKKVRKARNIPSGNTYRRVYDPWNIVDFRFEIKEGDRDYYKYRRK